MSKELPKDHGVSAHKDIVGQVMHRWKHHDPKPLHSGRGKGGKEGKIVKDQSQAVAIALSIAEKAKGGKGSKKGKGKTMDHSERLQALGFSEEVSNKVAKMLTEELDYTRCERPDGSFYGTGGSCRKGNEAEASPRGPIKRRWEERLNKIRDKVEEKQRSSSLSFKERELIKNYTSATDGGTFTKINACSRKPGCLDLKARAQASQLDRVLKKLPGNEDGVPFFRGIKVNDTNTEALYNSLRSSSPGSKMRDPGFGSYSFDVSTTKGFTKGGGKSILIISRNKQIRPMNTFSAIPEEDEGILPRGVESTIRRVREKGNTLIVEVD